MKSLITETNHVIRDKLHSRIMYGKLNHYVINHKTEFEILIKSKLILMCMLIKTLNKMNVVTSKTIYYLCCITGTDFILIPSW